MKRNLKTILVAAAALLLAAVMAGAAAKKTPVDVLDEVYFDGKKIIFAYTVSSVCPKAKHTPEVTVFAEKSPGKKKVTALYVEIQDGEPAEGCGSKAAEVTVAKEMDLGAVIKAELADLAEQGYTPADGLTVGLPGVAPRVRGASIAGGSVTIPRQKKEEDVKTGGTTTPAPKAPPPPTKVKVVEVDYQPMWHCFLRKNDGSRRDGFDGYGSTIEEARNDAAQGCMSTRHGSCLDFSKDPAHTSCGFELQERETAKEYDSDKIPQGTKIMAWNCELWKRDGARKDGFSGRGATEAEARAEAARGCGRTNHPLCEEFSQQAEHTTCAAEMRYEKPKPKTLWTCVLWKNDGSRRDGFKGTGETEDEARRNSRPGCYATNNGLCDQYSMDPSHTPCSAELYYPEQ